MRENMLPTFFMRSHRPVRTHTPDPPDGLQIAGLGRVLFQQAAQAGDLHINAALGGRVVLATTGQVHQLVTGERFARMTHQHLEHGELPAGQGNRFAITAQFTGRQIELVGPKLTIFSAAEGAPGSSTVWRRSTARIRQQLTGVERLGQIIVGPISRPTMRSTSSPWR